MSDNITIHINQETTTISVDFGGGTTIVNNGNKNVNPILENRGGYDLKIDSSFYTDLPIDSQLKLKEVQTPSFYKYHSFIFDNQRYVVEIIGLDDNEITFKDLNFDQTMQIPLDAIYELYEVKVIG